MPFMSLFYIAVSVDSWAVYTPTVIVFEDGPHCFLSADKNTELAVDETVKSCGVCLTEATQ